MDRRDLLKTTLLGTAASLLPSQQTKAALQATPAEIEGPFYPITQQKDKDFDLTLIEGHQKKALGSPILISGSVVDTAGKPIEDAMVELWQANAAGRYAHPRDTSTAPLDPHFQGWSIVPSGSKGAFKFKTIKPGAYKVAKDWTRPPHLHFKVTKRGYQPLITQMYFPEDSQLLRKDALFLRKPRHEQALMIATADSPEHYRYQIILAEIDQAQSPQHE